MIKENLRVVMTRLPKETTSGRAGDTIIEVMISTAILGLVLVLSFSSSTRSLNLGTQAANRNQAVAYAKEQVELLREAAANNKIANFPTDGSTFCIDPSSLASNRPGGSGLCYLHNQTIFGVVIKYNQSNKTYQITSKWQAKDTTDQVVLYYQTPQIIEVKGG